jgi:hypothetical protein
MTNPHIVVGPNNQCLCGLAGGTPVSCAEIIDSLDRLRVAGNYAGRSQFQVDTANLNIVLRPLIKDIPQ